MKPKRYRDHGLTDEDFAEIVAFFQDLMEMDRRGQELEKLVRVLRGRKQQLIKIHRDELLSQLRGLEKL